MDFYTKLFLVNFIVLVFIAIVDRDIFNDALEKVRVVGTALGIWSALTIISIPAWLVYLVVAW